MHAGDRVTTLYLLERNFRCRIHLRRGELGLPENQRKRHREAPGVRGTEQFLRIRSGLAFETARKAVRILFKRTALGGDCALAVLDSATPPGGAASLDLHVSSSQAGCLR